MVKPARGLFPFPIGFSFFHECLHALFLILGGKEHIEKPPLIGESLA